MFPIALDLTKIPVLLAGEGPAFTKRRVQLEEAGALNLTLFEQSLPTAEDMKDRAIIMVAGLPRAQAESIVTLAHSLGKLVNVEDVNDLCDFYFTANVKRGDLIIAVSTSGASPTLARKLRDTIGNLFGPEWAERTGVIAAERKAWKAAGKSLSEVQTLTEQYLAEHGWLK